MDQAGTTISGTSSITLSGGGIFNMSAGTLGYESGSLVTAEVQSGGIFNISGGTLAAADTTVTFNIAEGGILNTSGSMITGAGTLQINVNGGTYNQLGGSLSGGVTQINVSGNGSVTQYGKIANATGSSATIIVSDGGTYTMKYDAHLGEITGSSAITVSTGGTFIVESGGSISSRNTGHSAISVDGGIFTSSGSVLSSMCSYGSLEVKNGGTFTQNDGAVAYNVYSSHEEGISITVDDASYVMNGGRLGGNINRASSVPKVDIVVTNGGSFSQFGGELGLFVTNLTLTLENGGSFNFGGGTLGNASGTFDVVMGSGSAFSMSGTASMLGVVQFSLTEDAAFTQLGGTIAGSVSITLGEPDSTGAAAAFHMMEGDIAGSATITLNSGAQFEMGGEDAGWSGTPEIGGDAQIYVNAGSSFTQYGGVFGGNAELHLAAGALYELKNGSYESAALEAAEADTHITMSGGSMNTALSLAGGAEFSQTGGTFSGSISAEDASTSVTQGADGVINGDITLSDGASFSQSGTVSGGISVTDAEYTQEGGVISPGSSITLDENATFKQEDGTIFADVELDDSTFEQSGLISGSVTLNDGATFTQNQGGDITGSVTVNKGAFTQEAGGSISGDVTLSGADSSFTHGGIVHGNVSVSQQAQFTNNGADIGGNLLLDDAEVDLSGNLMGSATVQGGGELQQTSGTISGGVSVSGAQSSFSQSAGATVEGEVAVVDGQLDLGGTVSGGVRVTNAAATQTSDSTITGGVVMQGGTFRQSGSVSGGVSISGGGEYTVEGDSTVISGDVTVEGTGSVFSQTSGSISGSVSVSGGSGVQGGSVGGNVMVDNGSYTLSDNILSGIATAKILGSVTLTNSSSFMMHHSTIAGLISLADASEFKMDNGEIRGGVSITGSSTFTMQGGVSIGGNFDVESGSLIVTGGQISQSTITISSGGSAVLGNAHVQGNVYINLTGGSLTLQSGVTMDALVTLSSADSVYDLAGVAAKGSITLNAGNLKNASQYAGKITVDTAADISGAVNLGGAAAGTITSICTRSAEAYVSGIGNGTLSLTGANSMVVSAATAGTAATSQGRSLIQFESGSEGTLSLAEGGTFVLNVSMDLLTELGLAEKGGEFYVYVTNGTLDSDVIERFLFGAGYADIFSIDGSDGGVLKVNAKTLDKIWFASANGHGVIDAHNLSDFNASKSVVMDAAMTVALSSSATPAVFHQIIGDGASVGDLNISAGAAGITVEFNNADTISGSGNGNTVYNGNISVSGDYAAESVIQKTGDATLTLGGTLSTAGKLEVQAGTLALKGSGKVAGELALSKGAVLSIEDNLTLTGNSTLSAGKIIGGSITQKGGNLVLLDAMTVMSNVIVAGGGHVTQGCWLGGDVLVEGGSFTSKNDVGGSVIITGTGASYTNEKPNKSVPGSVMNAIISGSVTISGDQATMGNASNWTERGMMIRGGVEISGAGSSMTDIEKVIGDIVLSGDGSSFAGFKTVKTEVLGIVTLSGTGARATGIDSITGTGSIKSGATVSGDSAELEAGEITGPVDVSGEGAKVSATTSITGDVTISGAQAAVSAGGITGVVQVIGAGSTLTLTGASEADITLNASGAKVDFGGQSVTNSGTLTIYDGSLSNAGSYEGSVVINTVAAYGGTSLSLGGLDAAQVSNIKTASALSLTDLTGTLTFSGSDNVMLVGSQHVGIGSAAPREAMVQFSTGGMVEWLDEGASVKLQFSSDLLDSFGSGDLALWFTNGTLTGVDSLEDLQTHFLLATGSGVQFAYFDKEEEGKLYITASTDKVWDAKKQLVTELTEADAFTNYSKVIVDKDTSVVVEAVKGDSITVKQLEGDKQLTVTNTSTENDLTLELRNEAFYNSKGQAVSWGETSFYGDIVTSEGVNVAKTGNDTLNLNGNLKAAGTLNVQEGKLVLNGSANTADSLSFSTGADAPAGILELNGTLTISGESTLPEDNPNGLSGTGTLKLAEDASLTLSSDAVVGPSVDLASGSTLDVSPAGDGSNVTIGGLSGTGAVKNAGATLTISGGSGVFSGTLEGSGVLAIANTTQQTLSGDGNADFALRVDSPKASLNLETDQAEYKSLTSFGNLRIAPAGIGANAASIGQVSVAEEIYLAAGSVTEFVVNFDSASGVSEAPMLHSSKSVELVPGQSFILTGVGMGEDMPTTIKLTLIAADEGIVQGDAVRYANNDADNTIANGTELHNVTMSGLINLFYTDGTTHVIDNAIVFEAEKRTQNLFLPAASTFNSQAGASLVWNARYTMQENPNVNPTLLRAAAALADMAVTGNAAETSRALAAVAGSTVTALSSAQSDALRDQLSRTRTHARQMNLGATPEHSAHAWVEGIGSFAKLDTKGDESGYKLDSWGGSVGVDKTLGKSINAGFSLTALYGDLNATASESASGKLDAYYLSAYGSAAIGRWSHAFALVGGITNADLDRNVDLRSMSYSTSGSTSGYSLGAFYEVAYSFYLDEQKRNSISPIAGVAVNHVSLSGYSETGADGAGLRVDSQSRTLTTLTLGVRWSTALTKLLGTESRFELETALAQDIGDRRSTADVALLGNPSYSTAVRGAEVGSTALRLGMGVSLPVATDTWVFFNSGADFRSGSSVWNVNLGLRLGF